MIRLDAPIPYATLAEQLTFNTKSRMELFEFQQTVVQVHGPVCRVELDGKGALLHLGTQRESRVRAYFTKAAEFRNLREGQEVVVTGTFSFQGSYILLEDASLRSNERTPSPPQPVVSRRSSSRIDEEP